MKYGISTACFYPLQTEDAVVQMSENGIKNIEIFFNTFSEIEKNFIKNLKNTLDDSGQTVLAIHPFTCAFEPFLLFTGYKRRFDDALDFYKRYFETMNLLDTKIFVLHGDRRQSTLTNPEYFERFAKLRDIGKEFEIIVAQENVERCKSGDLIFLEEMIHYLDNDVALVFDNKQAVRSGITYEQFINTVGNNIVHMHISDNSDINDCLPIGKGTVDFVDLLKKMQEIEKVHENIGIVVELYSERIASHQDIYDSYFALTSL